MAALPGGSTGLSAPAGASAPNGPGAYPLQLGGVVFWSDECPEMLPIGGVSQMEQTHQLIGGTRIVQTFGPNPESVSWSGRFWSPNITVRVQQLRLYAVNGVRIAVTWKGEQYTCIITKFQPRFHAQYCDYEIEIVITQDDNGAFTLSSPTSIDAQVASLFVQAQGANQLVLASLPAQSSLSTQFPALPASTVTSANAAYAYQPALTNLQAVIQAAGPIAANITTAGPAIAAAALSAAAGISTYQGTLSGSDPNYVNAAVLYASVMAIAQNAQRGQTANATVTQGGSLFTLAAAQYGDITQAYAIAQANGMPSPFLSSQTPTTVKTPPFVAMST